MLFVAAYVTSENRGHVRPGPGFTSVKTLGRHPSVIDATLLIDNENMRVFRSTVQMYVS